MRELSRNFLVFAEVGGRKKGKKQISGAAEGYVVQDDTEYVFDNRVPLWMFGFLY